MSPWLLFFACGLATFAIRLSFIAAEGRFQPPGWFRRLLPYVPVAALTALVVPELLVVGGKLHAGLDNPRLLAGTVAIAVAAIWRNTVLTIGAGFAAFFLLSQ